MQISLSKALAIIDAERGKRLPIRTAAKAANDIGLYNHLSSELRLLNRLKKEFSHLSDADQLPLGL